MKSYLSTRYQDTAKSNNIQFCGVNIYYTQRSAVWTVWLHSGWSIHRFDNSDHSNNIIYISGGWVMGYNFRFRFTKKFVATVYEYIWLDSNIVSEYIRQGDYDQCGLLVNILYSI